MSRGKGMRMEFAPPVAPEAGDFLPLASRPLGMLTIVMEEPEITLIPAPHGHRKVIRVTGGAMVGPRLRARVLPGGGDWALFRGDGVLTLDVRLTLRTDDGALIYMQYMGYRAATPEVADRLARGAEVGPDEMYYRIAPTFETADPRYDWLNRVLSIGVGERPRCGPRYHIHEIL